VPQRLRVEEILTVGFVDRGDDPEAEIVFFKRKPEEETKEGGVRKLIIAMAEKLGFAKNEVEELLADEAADSSMNDGGLNLDGESAMTFDVSKLEGEALDAFNAAVTAAVEERMQAEGGQGEVTLPEDLPESVTKVLDSFQKQLDDATARAETAEKRVATMEDAAETNRYIRKAAELGLPGASPDDLAPILRKAEANLEAEEVEKLTQILKSAAAAIELTTEIGGPGGVEDSLAAEVAGLAKSFTDADPTLSKEMAEAKVWESRPDLYKKFRTRRDSRLNVGD